MSKMKRVLAVAAIAVMVLAGCDVSVPPRGERYAGGWTPRFTRSNGDPMTQFCGDIPFSIHTNGSSTFRQKVVDVMWQIHNMTGRHFSEVEPGQVVNGIEIHNGGVTFQTGVSGWANVQNNGWNITKAKAHINPAVAAQYVHQIIRHEVAHTVGMHHTYKVQSIMDSYYSGISDYTMVDGAGLIYTLHPDSC